MQNPDAISRRWFDPSTVTVAVDQNVPQILANEDYIGLSGAMSHSTVHVSFVGGLIQLEVLSPAVRRMIRRIVYDMAAEALSVWNAKFVIRPEFRGQDLAVRSIVVQARCAANLGFAYLSTYAAGDISTATAINQAEAWSGYYVWPRLGFNAEIPEDVASLLPPELRYATTLIDLVSTARGAQFWFEHGHGLDLKFDLTDRSISWQTLMRYTSERQIGV